MTISSYAFAATWNVALASLNNVENHLGSVNLSPEGARRSVRVKSDPVDLFPIRTRLESGRERGDGQVDHAWELWMYTTAYTYLVNTYFSGGSVVSTKWTIYTRRHDMGTYARYNCYVVLPSIVARPDLTYRGRDYMRVIVRFNDLVASS